MATTVTPQIVIVNAKVQPAPAVNTLQQTGAIVSFGATTLAANKYSYCAAMADVTSILAAAGAITSIDVTSGTATATVASIGDLAVGQTFYTTIAGATPAALNGTALATVASATTFTFATTATGNSTVSGTFTAPSQQFVTEAATVFFAQGVDVGVYVLELGPVETWADAITALQTYIDNYSTTPQVFYAYDLPGEVDATSSAALNTLAQDYASASGQTYFFIDTTQANLNDYTATKSIVATVPPSTAAVGDVTSAALFAQVLDNDPGPANALAPLAFRFVYAVPDWAQAGNSNALETILTAGGNIILTGSEANISNEIIEKGTTMDLSPQSEWYGLDWFAIEAHQALAAAIINGSNSTTPLLYSQGGINTLLAIAQRVASDAVAYGCASSITVTAVPFSTYIANNPDDYAAGIYNGLAATFLGQTGFLSITFNLTATF